MSTVKESTKQSKPTHALVKAAEKKGLTNFKITWHKAMSRSGRGWVLESDQVKWQRIGYDQASALNAINALNF